MVLKWVSYEKYCNGLHLFEFLVFSSYLLIITEIHLCAALDKSICQIHMKVKYHQLYPLSSLQRWILNLSCTNWFKMGCTKKIREDLCVLHVCAGEICSGRNSMGNVVSLSISDLSALICPRAGSPPVECNSLILSVFSVYLDECRATFASLAFSTWLAFFVLHTAQHWHAASLLSQNTRWTCWRVWRQLTWQLFPPPGLSEPQCH